MLQYATTERRTMHVYRLRVSHVSTATVGRRREVGREEVVAMVRRALRASQVPEEVRELLVVGAWCSADGAWCKMLATGA